MGPQRDDVHTAMLAERITNSLGGTPKGQRPKRVRDFLPDWTATPEEEADGVDQEPADQAGDHR
ncbi:phage tail assembly protein T [Nonomuraea sp. NPDC002799]